LNHRDKLLFLVHAGILVGASCDAVNSTRESIPQSANHGLPVSSPRLLHSLTDCTNPSLPD
jgi:hypothetical protein